MAKEMSSSDITYLDESNNSKRNKYLLLCPDERCRCKILRKGVGKYEEKTGLIVGSLDITFILCGLYNLPPLPGNDIKTATDFRQEYFTIPDMMAFENIGFSKTVTFTQDPAPSSSSSTISQNDSPTSSNTDTVITTKAPATQGSNQVQVKYLSCADCDVGPLGLQIVGTRECYLKVDRVRHLTEDAVSGKV
ncbi:Mss4-like protein [Paraphysoderma sedebokerense]|nr:Mss4-like protein [Paraphysoderma sedebokerense]KAI9138906.1 Mss4-like protein [Paraphysoderma sedebokerense]